MKTIADTWVSADRMIRESLPWLLAFTVCVVGSIMCLRRTLSVALCGEGVHHAHLRSRFLRVWFRVWQLRCPCWGAGCSPWNYPFPAHPQPPGVAFEVRQLAYGVPVLAGVAGDDGSCVASVDDDSGAFVAATSAVRGVYEQPHVAA